MRSCQDPCRLVLPCMLMTCTGPEHLCRASACCGTCDCVRFPTEIFEDFARPQNFALEIAWDRAEIHAAWWCAACSRSSEVPYIRDERRHAVAREIACGSLRISDRNFRKFCAAGKFCVRNRVRSRRNPCRLVVSSLLTILRGPLHP